MEGVFAAAGLAEAAWAGAACMLYFALGLMGVVALFALAFRSRRLAGMAVVLMLFCTLFFEPWRCFSPFEESAYADPDVQSAAEMFKQVGMAWVFTCVAVIGSVLFTFLVPRKGQPIADPLPQEPEDPS